MIEVALGIDVGTSGVRIAARDRDGAMLAMASAPINVPVTDFSRSLQDPFLWWGAVGAAFRALDLKGLQVLSLAIDGTSGTVLPVDAVGKPVGMASMYNDVAEDADVKRVAGVATEDSAARGATSPLARALAMQTGATRIVHQADWLMGCFCGVFDVSDENNALKTGYDPVVRKWPEWIPATGMDVVKLPRVVAVGERVGAILPAIAETLGLPKHVAVVAGTTDGCAGFLASGASEPGDGATSLGTTITLKLLSASPVFAPQFGIYSHRIGDQWLAGGASNSGGAVLKQFFSSDEIVRLTGLIDPAVPTGLDYYPLLQMGERFPINDPTMQSKVTPRPQEEQVFLQGLLEGMASIEALGYRRLAELGATPLKNIRSAGGGAANDKWTSIRLKALGVLAAPSASEHAAMGTARLAWRGIGHNA
jgi:sugar (pentulose or hexulose) kinase